MREIMPFVLEAEQEILGQLSVEERIQLLQAIAAVEAALGLGDEEDSL